MLFIKIFVLMKFHAAKVNQISYHGKYFLLILWYKFILIKI